MKVESVKTEKDQVYKLPDAARKAILAQSTSARMDRKIEDQYTFFLEKNNGCAFGQKFESKI